MSAADDGKGSDHDRAHRRPRRLAPDAETERWVLRLLGKVAGYALLGAAGLWVLWRVKGVLPPFAAALLLAVALVPLVDRMEARGIRRGMAVAVVYLGFFGALTGLVYFLVPLVSNQIGAVAGELRERFRLDQTSDVNRVVTEQVRILGRQMSVPSFILQPILTQAKNSASLLTRGLEAFGQLLLGMLPNLLWFVLVPIVGLYALVDYHRIVGKALLLVPRPHRDSVRGLAVDVAEVFSKYLRGLLLVCVLDTAATIAVLLMFPSTRAYAAALGLVAGILYAVPYLGAIFSTALIALVAFAAGGPGAMLWVTAAMVLLHQIVFDQVIAPRVLGGQVGLHPILSILALLAGDALFGITGMLLAVPAAASLQVIAVHLLPRLARRVDVEIHRDPPDFPRPQDDEERRPPARIPAGEGVTGEPRG